MHQILLAGVITGAYVGCCFTSRFYLWLCSSVGRNFRSIILFFTGHKLVLGFHRSFLIIQIWYLLRSFQSFYHHLKRDDISITPFPEQFTKNYSINFPYFQRTREKRSQKVLQTFCFSWRLKDTQQNPFWTISSFVSVFILRMTGAVSNM